MAGSGERDQRREILAELAAALAAAGGPGQQVQTRRGRTRGLVPYLSVRAAGRDRLRVYCAASGGQYALLTSTGTVIRLDAGVAAAAALVAEACGCGEPGPAGAGRAAAARPG